MSQDLKPKPQKPDRAALKEAGEACRTCGAQLLLEATADLNNDGVREALICPECGSRFSRKPKV